MPVRARRALDAATALLDAPRERRRGVSGRRGEREIVFSIEGSGWRVETSIPRAPYVIDIVGRDAYFEEWDRGVVIDVTTGDACFDARYVVRGAPRALLTPLLGALACRDILALSPTRIVAESGRLTIAKQYTYYYAEPDDIARAIELTAALADRVEDLVRAGERRALRSAAAGAPFRAEPDVAAVARVLTAQHDEVAAYRAVQLERRRRRRRRLVMSVAFGGVWLVADLVLAFLS